MGKKSKAPQAPDMVAVAKEQGAQNRAAATDVMNQNRYTQIGPEGSSNRWVTDPATGQTTNITEAGGRPKALYEALMDNSTANLGAFQSKYWGSGGGAAQAQGMAPGGTMAGVGGGLPAGMGGGGGGGGMQGGIYAPDKKSGVGGVGTGIQGDLDYTSLGAMPTVDENARQQVQDALYKRQTGYLDPQYEQSQQSLETQLSNQGLVPGTEAYNRAYANLAGAKEKSYAGARNDAIIGGGAEQQRLLEMALALRGQGKSEIDTKGGFHNAAQGQRAGQLLEDVGQTRAANATTNAASIHAGASMSNAALANQLATREQEFNEIMRASGGANQFLPTFNTSQGNMGSYKPADIVGATEANYSNAMDQYNANQARKQFLPKLIGGVAGSALGGSLGGAVGKGLVSRFMPGG